MPRCNWMGICPLSPRIPCGTMTRSQLLERPVAHTPRLIWLDAARGAALLAMIVYHTVFDLQLFGHLPPGTATSAFWRPWAQATAGSFLFLAGLSLYMAHADGVRWRAYGRRMGRLIAAAGLITAATYASDPGSFIFFGILHAIAAFSLLGVPLLRAPRPVLAGVALGLLVLGPSLTHPVFQHPALLWTGLSPRVPYTLDFEPLFPWAGPFVAGMLAARLLPLAALRAGQPHGRATRVLCWGGRHSLAIYLLHQPVLLALIWAGTRALGAG